MVEDILKFYPLKSRGYKKGLFATHKNEWVNIGGLNRTQFIEAKEIKIDKDITLLDMFHGYCVLFMSYFITKQPSWNVMLLERPDSFQKIVHCFATKTINGVTYFADARGITDNCLEFFSDFRFCKDNMNIKEFKKLPELSYEQMLWMKKSYDIIFDSVA